MSEKMLKIFIGYDAIESTAWHTMAHSIFTRCSAPISITPINIKNLSKIFTRERDIKQSNEFSFSRFLVPYLSDYLGYAVYFDCDMLVRVDLMEILDVVHTQPNKAVYVVKHNYEPRDNTKFLNTAQYSYPRKNWSSVVLWNCAHPANKKITPEYVNTASGMELHRFMWLKDEEIGELDVRWNWLVGEYEHPPGDVKNLHWTIGGPYFNEYKDSDYSEEWFEENRRMNYCLQRCDKN